MHISNLVQISFYLLEEMYFHGWVAGVHYMTKQFRMFFWGVNSQITLTPLTCWIFFFSFLFALCNYQRETSTSSEVAEVGSSIHGSRKIDYSSACLFHVLLSLLLTLFSLRLKHSLFCLTWQWKCSDIYHKRVGKFPWGECRRKRGILGFVFPERKQI